MFSPWTGRIGTGQSSAEEEKVGAYWWGDKIEIIQGDEGDDFQFGYEDEEEESEIHIEEEVHFPDEEDQRNASYTFEDLGATSDGKNAPVIIMQMYGGVCQIMSKLIKESNFEFRRDPLYTPGFFHRIQVNKKREMIL